MPAASPTKFVNAMASGLVQIDVDPEPLHGNYSTRHVHATLVVGCRCDDNRIEEVADNRGGGGHGGNFVDGHGDFGDDGNEGDDVSDDDGSEGDDDVSDSDSDSDSDSGSGNNIRPSPPAEYPRPMPLTKWHELEATLSAASGVCSNRALRFCRHASCGGGGVLGECLFDSPSAGPTGTTPG